MIYCRGWTSKFSITLTTCLDWIVLFPCTLVTPNQIVLAYLPCQRFDSDTILVSSQVGLIENIQETKNTSLLKRDQKFNATYSKTKISNSFSFFFCLKYQVKKHSVGLSDERIVKRSHVQVCISFLLTDCISFTSISNQQAIVHLEF